MNVVIDPSFAAGWVIAEERSLPGDQLVNEITAGDVSAITVPLFWYEFRNVLVINERRGKLDAGPIKPLEYMRLLPIRVMPDPDDEEVVRLAQKHQLTAYDACYLALAISSKSTLATNDRQLARAAQHWDLPLRTALSVEQLKS